MSAEPRPHPEPLLMSEDAYLTFDAQSDIKHEFVDGHAYAMTGASWNHNVINSNVQSTLNSQLADQPCRAMSSDMRLKVQSKSVSFRYPDTLVMCGEPIFAAERTDIVTNPTVIVEVLSSSTALKDRNEKLDEYIQIDSLQHYVLIAQDAAKIEVFTRQASDQWLYTQAKGTDASLKLASIGCTLHLAMVYDGVQFTPDDA